MVGVCSSVRLRRIKGCPKTLLFIRQNKIKCFHSCSPIIPQICEDVLGLKSSSPSRVQLSTKKSINTQVFFYKRRNSSVFLC